MYILNGPVFFFFLSPYHRIIIKMDVDQLVTGEFPLWGDKCYGGHVVVSKIRGGRKRGQSPPPQPPPLETPPPPPPRQ